MKEFVEKLIGRLEEQTYDMEICEEQFDMNSPYFMDVEYKMVKIDDIKDTVNQLAEEYNNGWIPFTQRELDEEEKEYYGDEIKYMLDCKLPDDGEEIIVCYKNGYVDTDTFIRDTDGCYLDSGNDFIDDVIAWMPLPAPYQKGSDV